LLLDLKVTPSGLFIKAGDDGTAVEDPDAAPEDGDLLGIEWWCKMGMAANIDKVKKEFEKKRNLNPFKIFVTGPPCSGKTRFGGKLAEHYNVPHIHMERLIADLRSWDQEKEDIWRGREAKRQAMIDEIEAKEKA